MIPSFNLTNVSKILGQAAKEYTVETVKKYFPETADKVQKFSQSILGKQVISQAKALVSESVGMSIGSSYPQAMIGYSIGQTAAEHLIADSEGNTVSEQKTWIIWTAGVGGALAITALSSALSYITTGDQTMATIALGYMVTSIGTILGGMQGVRLAGQEIPQSTDVFDSYPVRTFQYLAAQNAVTTVRNKIPISLPLTGVVGCILKMAAGPVGYHARPLAQLAVKIYSSKPQADNNLNNLYDPGEFTSNLIQRTYGDSTVFARSLVSQHMNFMPFVGLLAHYTLQRVVDEKSATNAFVRALNSYTKIIQDQSIQEASQSLAACSPSDINLRKSRQETLLQTINEKILGELYASETGLAYITQLGNSGVIDQIVKVFVEKIQEGEVKMIGFTLSNPEKLKDFLEVHAVCFMSFALVMLTREGSSALLTKNSSPLTKDEIQEFYLNLNRIILSPYGDYKVVRGVKMIAEEALPFALEFGKSIPGKISEIVADAINESPYKPAVIKETVIQQPVSKWSWFLSLFTKPKNVILYLWKNLVSLLPYRKKRASHQIDESEYIRQTLLKIQNTVQRYELRSNSRHFVRHEVL